MSSPLETTVLIIGAGPAGISSAIQLKRCRIPFILLEKSRVGGLLWNANLIENYPGFPSGIPGPELVCLLEEQLAHLEISIRKEEVRVLDRKGNEFSVSTDRNEYRAYYAVVASGTQPRQFPLRVPVGLRRRVSSDVVSLLDMEKKHIVIIGSGDAAFDHALNMAKKRNFITILNQDQEVKCLTILKERAFMNKAINYFDQVKTLAITPDNSSQGVVIKCESNGNAWEIKADHVVTAIGREPQLDFLSNTLLTEKERWLASEELYFIGDVHNGFLRQMAIAAGEGVRTAMLIQSHLHNRA